MTGSVSGRLVVSGVVSGGQICGPEVQATTGPPEVEAGQATRLWLDPVGILDWCKVGEEIVADQQPHSGSLGIVMGPESGAVWRGGVCQPLPSVPRVS